MPDTDVFPRFMFPAGGPTEPDYGGRSFASKEELDAASGDGPWYATPQEAQAASTQTLRPGPEGEGDETPARRSHHRQP